MRSAQGGQRQKLKLGCSRGRIIWGLVNCSKEQLNFTPSEIKCLWMVLSKGVLGSDLGFSSKSLLLLLR